MSTLAPFLHTSAGRCSSAGKSGGRDDHALFRLHPPGLSHSPSAEPPSLAHVLPGSRCRCGGSRSCGPRLDPCRPEDHCSARSRSHCRPPHGQPGSWRCCTQPRCRGCEVRITLRVSQAMFQPLDRPPCLPHEGLPPPGEGGGREGGALGAATCQHDVLRAQPWVSHTGLPNASLWNKRTAEKGLSLASTQRRRYHRAHRPDCAPWRQAGQPDAP